MKDIISPNSRYYGAIPPATLVKAMMQYSLMARFRGTLMGAVLGYHTIAARSGSARSGEQPLELSKTTACLRHLGEEGATSIPWASFAPAPSLDAGGHLAVVSLPLMLYYHDREAQLHLELQAAATTWNLPQEATLAARVLAETIALALLEELDLQRLPLQLIAGLDLPANGPAARQLSQLQVAHEECHSWAIAHYHLQHLNLATSSGSLPLPLLLALYSFLRSPQDMQLALSLPEHEDAVITGLMVGAIAGSFNGTVQLPFQSWPVPLSTLALWDLAQFQDLQTLSDQLLAHWAGVYRPRIQGTSVLKGAIAAPQMLRPPA